MTGLILTWAALLLLLLVEVVAAVGHAGWIAWFTAPVMIMLVAAVFMKVTSASGLSRVFALAGVFWVCVLLGLGTMDYWFRRVTPAPGLTAPYAAAR